jgi:undecaprenyl diphosphate synthase
MDGNGRWAKRRGLPRTEGHAAGEVALFDVIEGALTIGVRWLTMYAFSTENWRRPPDEVRYLMGFNESLLLRRREELLAKGVRIRFSGRRDWRVPRRVLRRMDESVAMTAGNRRMTLTLAFNTAGGRRSSTPCGAWSPRACRPPRSTSGRSSGTSTSPTCPIRTS